jgi:hypothetical protein
VRAINWKEYIKKKKNSLADLCPVRRSIGRWAGQKGAKRLPIDRGTKRSVLSISSSRYFAFVKNPDLSSQILIQGNP